MKIRDGFVSNSSSSSFILALARKPESVEELRELLFLDAEEYTDPYTDDTWSTEALARVVFDDLGPAKPLTKKDLIEEVSRGTVEGQPEYSAKTWRKDWDTWAKKYVADFVRLTKGKTYYMVSYADSYAGLEAVIEHGDVFKRIPHIDVSNH